MQSDVRMYLIATDGGRDVALFPYTNLSLQSPDSAIDMYRLRPLINLLANLPYC